MIITCKKVIPVRWMIFTILPWASFTFNFQVMGQAFVFSLRKFVENPAGLTFILSLPSFIAIIVAPLVSFLSDRIWTRFGRRKPFIIAGWVGIIVSMIAMPLAPNIWVLITAYLLYNISDAIDSPSEPLKQEIVPPAARAKAMGAQTWCQSFAQVVFFFAVLGRFDDVQFIAGFPISGEKVIYWSAAMLITVMLFMIVLGIKEVDQRSPLVGQRLSFRNFAGGILDRELWPVYLLVFCNYLINIYTGFGPFLSTLLYTEQWNYTKQEMGTNVALGSVVNLILVGGLTIVANRLPRMKAFRTLICLCLAWNVCYFCYVNFVLPDRRPTLTEIFVFGEVLTILSILVGLIYTPLIYDYVRRNKMGTFAAGAQIATRATQLFTLNGVGLFVWAYATLFQPPAGQITRVVLQEEQQEDQLNESLRNSTWSTEGSATPSPSKDISARAWNADGVVAESGRTWEIRLRDPRGKSIAEEQTKLEEQLSPLFAKRAARADQQHREHTETAALDESIDQLQQQQQSLKDEQSRRSRHFQAQIEKTLGLSLMRMGEQIRAARHEEACVVQWPLTTHPEPEQIEEILDALRLEIPSIVDLRPIKRNSDYLLELSLLPVSQTDISAANSALSRIAEVISPGLLHPAPLPGHRRESALTLEVQTVEVPISGYVSPVTRATNGLKEFLGRKHHPNQRLAAVARNLRFSNETDHVRVTAIPRERLISVTALITPSAKKDERVHDTEATRITALLPASRIEDQQQAVAFYRRIAAAAASQRLTIAQPVLASTYAPMRYDYMSGYIWVFIVGALGISLALIFGRLEARGVITKKGVEEAGAS